MNTCRLCRDWHGTLVKYGVRHYAHPECALTRWGAAFFEKLSPWQLRQFPVLVAHKHNVLLALEEGIAKFRETQSSPEPTVRRNTFV